MSVLRVWRDNACAIEVYDDQGDGQPCNRPVTGWAWYDGSEHEPMLSQVCAMHETDGAADIAALLAERDALAQRLAQVKALADQYGEQARAEGYGGELWSTTEAAIRAALGGEDA